MNPSNKYNIKNDKIYGIKNGRNIMQQDGGGFFDIFESAGKNITQVGSSKFSKEAAKQAAMAGV